MTLINHPYPPLAGGYWHGVQMNAVRFATILANRRRLSKAELNEPVPPRKF